MSRVGTKNDPGEPAIRFRNLKTKDEYFQKKSFHNYGRMISRRAMLQDNLPVIFRKEARLCPAEVSHLANK